MKSVELLRHKYVTLFIALETNTECHLHTVAIHPPAVDSKEVR